MSAVSPLNGSKTHPLTEHGWRALSLLSTSAKMPAQMLNPGVVNRLLREGLVEIYPAPTPYPTRKGNILWLQINPAGREKIRERPPQKPPGLRRRVSARPVIGAGPKG